MATDPSADAELARAIVALGRRLQGPLELKTAAGTLPAEVLALNDAVRRLADERLSFWHDPADFRRVFDLDDEPRR
jgi:hypothetical protein